MQHPIHCLFMTLVTLHITLLMLDVTGSEAGSRLESAQCQAGVSSQAAPSAVTAQCWGH